MATGRFFPLQTLDLSPTGDPSDFNVSALPIGAQLGQVYEQDGKCYRLVQFDNGTGNVAAVVGGAAYWKSKASYIVTSDATDAEAAAVNGVAGGFLDVLTDQYYGLIQIGGDQTGVSVAAGTAVGGQLSGSTTDMQLAKTDAGTASVNVVVATALTAVSGGTSTVRWNLGALL